MSQIQEFFTNKTVLITGATGFIGGVLLQRLLSSCPGLSEVIVLARHRYGHTSAGRLRALLSLPLFDELNEEAKRKVSIVTGDVTAPVAGLCLSDLLRIKESVHVVFHLAADVNFSSPLDKAIITNLGGTSALLSLAKRMKHLQAFIHVSTAYSNCTVTDNIEEKVYPSPWDPVEFLHAAKKLSSEFINESTEGYLKDHPNSYTFSKQLAENLIADSGEDLPIAIVRPSIVVSIADRPLKGWSGDLEKSPFELIAGASPGAIEEVQAIADLVPCDYLAAFLLATAWRTAFRWRLEVYHFTSGTVSPIDWSEFSRCSMKHFGVHRTRRAGIFNSFQTAVNAPHKKFGNIGDEYSHRTNYTSYSGLTHLSFDTSNTMDLWKEMSDEDRSEFWFSMENFDWDSYIKTCVLHISNLGANNTTAPHHMRRKVGNCFAWFALIYLIATAVNIRIFHFGICLVFVLILYWI